MAPGLRSFFVVLVLGQGFALWWMSGQQQPANGTAADPAPAASGKAKKEPAPLVVWEATSPAGKFWGNEGKKKVIDLDDAGDGKAVTLRFEGDGWRGCGVNWKGWYPADAATDASKHRSLTFRVRQLTQVPDADLTVHLVDNVQRKDKTPAGNGLSVLRDGGLSRIDGEWRKVVLSLKRFADGKDLDLTRLWGVDFSDASGKTLAFQIDRIAFTDDFPPYPKFAPGGVYSAAASVSIDKPGHTIRDEIYGACQLPPEKVSAYGLPVLRWGGNRSSRYNWQVNADAAGKDWFFRNGGRPVKDPADNGWVRFVKDNQAVGATSYLTVPTLGFVAKDHDSHAFSVKKYGPQNAAEPGHPDVGNGVLASGGLVTGNDWRDTSVEAGPDFIADGVRLVVRQAGRAGDAKPGVRYWVLDNEPMLWHDTHRDVHPKPVGYEELWERTVKYAEAIKKADPTAKVAGFCSWGWTDLFYSAADENGDGYRSQPDHRSHGRVPLAEWFIRKCGEYKKAHGTALVDVFDFHWYPQPGPGGRAPYTGTGMDLKLNQYRLRSTGDLWDPNYEPESWIRQAGDGRPATVLRRVRGWIDRHNPGMEVCVGEYNFGGADNITGALAQADAFGILAKERADLAFVWAHPEGTQELAWKLFRNYDGAGGRFGDRHLPADSPHPDLAVFAAKRSKDGATTIAVVNKSLTDRCTVKLAVPGLKGKVRVWRFDQETGESVVEVPTEAAEVNGEIRLTVPAASGTILVVE